MLGSLYIRNYAIIRELEINFNEGLSTITGETGAGKSILLGALSLILGQRADMSVLLDKKSKCIIEGEFNNVPTYVKEVLTKNELDVADPLIIRREISAAGKSRAFVNDTPVNLPLLKEIGELLVDIHSQHENLNLGNNIYQLQVLDAFSQNEDLLGKYREQFSVYSQLKTNYRQLLANKAENQKELDYLSFQFEELEKAKLHGGEMKELEKELEVLQHSEDIKSALLSAAFLLNDEENGVNKRLKQIESDLQKSSSYHKLSSELKERITSSLIELRDIAQEAEQAGETIEHDPSRQEYVEERLGLIYRLLQKHQVETDVELVDIYKELDEKINDLASYEFKLGEVKEKLDISRKDLEQTGKKLSDERLRNISPLQEKIKNLLKQLGIPNADFKILALNSEDPGEYGYDNISFLFSANRKSEPKDISKIASGGELSRLMLSIKYIISNSLGLPTIIFDEIDTGVSGEIAHKVSLMMKEISEDRQVFTITHLPQVAARGSHHFLVFKTDDNAHTETRLKLLSSEERLQEIAKMLSGEQTTKAAMENARDLLGM